MILHGYPVQFDKKGASILNLLRAKIVGIYYCTEGKKYRKIIVMEIGEAF